MAPGKVAFLVFVGIFAVGFGGCAFVADLAQRCGRGVEPNIDKAFAAMMTPYVHKPAPTTTTLPR